MLRTVLDEPEVLSLFQKLTKLPFGMSYSQPVCLDLFCGGGGAAEGYRRAGFRVIGVDNADHQASFSKVGEFHQMDWLEGLEKYIGQADFVHASPPCQLYSALTKWGRKENLTSHPNLVPPTREALEVIDGKPWIIENVEGAPLINPVMLCSWTFGYEHYRHRIFEAGGGLVLAAPPHLGHKSSFDGRVGRRCASPGHWQGKARDEGWFVSVGGHFAPAALCREVMDETWMSNPEVAESIPPYFTHYLGAQVVQHLLVRQGWRQPGPQARDLIWAKDYPYPGGSLDRLL
jgi:DNA (cytosine-5)-methyltransferase 1